MPGAKVFLSRFPAGGIANLRTIQRGLPYLGAPGLTTARGNGDRRSSPALTRFCPAAAPPVQDVNTI